jgi:hypothetical protein
VDLPRGTRNASGSKGKGAAPGWGTLSTPLPTRAWPRAGPVTPSPLRSYAAAVNDMSISKTLSDASTAACSSPLPGLTDLTQPAHVGSRGEPRVEASGTRSGRQPVNHSSADFRLAPRWAHMCILPTRQGAPTPTPPPVSGASGRTKNTAWTLGAQRGSGAPDDASETRQATIGLGRTAPMAPRSVRPVGSRHNVSLSTMVLALPPIVGNPAI